MLIAVIDTSSAAVTAGVVDVRPEPQGPAGLEVLAERVTINERGHGELLAPSLQGCLAEAAVHPQQLGAVVAGLGPGPYTGLRVGLVTAAVLADLLGIPAYGVCSLDAIAISAPGGADLLVAADARRKEVYWAHYDPARVRVRGPEVSRPQDVPTEGIGAMAGAGARLFAAELGLHLLEADYPGVTGLAHCASQRVASAAPTETLTPLYLRRPDAVVNVASKRVTQ
ncbi:MAG: tRNA (adenosine(37)-N6)-threonylcarbamoyltransferase complex dimerization subunit type 1 TsaB [Actinomycetota bacterium]|nr:tRNA (adenosine(37)-N6)-threonylcarbamoyltransferase complex dimerization subunit type 1 TsaB [Actinomycetota bacterium]